jgi:tRNA 2-selenouridine synthase
MPDAIKIKARQSDIIILNASLEHRLSISLKSYVIDMAQKFIALHGDFGFQLYSNYWLNSLSKIQKRLGGDRYKILLKQLNLALINHQKNEDLNDYLPLIESLLVDYYDPMYNYQIEQKKQRIIFRGNYEEVTSYLKES